MSEASATHSQTSMGSHASTLLRATAAYGINALVAPLFTVILTPIYARVLTPADYGVLEVVLTLSAVLSVIGTLGLRTVLAIFLQRESDDTGRRVIATALWMGAGGAAILALLGTLASGTIARIWLRDEHLAPTVVLALANMPCSVLFLLLVDGLRLRQEIWRASALGIAQVVLLACGNIVLVVLLRGGVRGALGAQLAAYGILIVIGMILAPRLFFVRLHSALVRSLLVAGLPLIPAGIATVALGVADRPLLLQMGVSADQIGVYAVGNKLASMLTFVSMPFQAAWTPFALSISQRPEARQIYARVLIYYLTLMLGSALALGLFAREALIFVGTHRYVGAQQYVWLLAYTNLIQGSYAIVSIGLYLTEKTRHLAWTSLVGALVNIALNLLLVPWLGVLGAAIATPLGYVCGPLGAYLVAQRLYAIPYDLRRVGLLFGIQLALLAVGLAWSDTTSLLTLGVRGGLLVLYPLVLVALRVIDRREVALGWTTLRQRLKGFGKTKTP